MSSIWVDVQSPLGSPAGPLRIFSSKGFTPIWKDGIIFAITMQDKATVPIRYIYAHSIFHQLIGWPHRGRSRMVVRWSSRSAACFVGCEVCGKSVADGCRWFAKKGVESISGIAESWLVEKGKRPSWLETSGACRNRKAHQRVHRSAESSSGAACEVKSAHRNDHCMRRFSSS